MAQGAANSVRKRLRVTAAPASRRGLKRRVPSARRDSPLRFFTAFVRRPLTMGAFWPSSPALSRVVVDSCELRANATVVELGPGTGAFTGVLLRRLHARGRLLAVEINPSNATVLRRRFPECEVIEDSAENLAEHLGGQRVDCIVSGLAWGNMLPRTQNRILRAVLKSLKPGGQFVAFAYLHAAWFPTTRLFRRRLLRHFQRVITTPVVWRNLPPAYVFRCWR